MQPTFELVKPIGLFIVGMIIYSVFVLKLYLTLFPLLLIVPLALADVH